MVCDLLTRWQNEEKKNMQDTHTIQIFYLRIINDNTLSSVVRTHTGAVKLI
jgi:hypothetical protein